MGLKFILISLGFLALTGVAWAEESIEDIIQQHVVETCDKLNKPKLSTCDKRDLAASSSLPKEVATTETPPPNLSRCDRNRADTPASTKANNYIDTAFEVSTVSKQEAQEVFAYVSKQKSRYGLHNPRVATAVCTQRAELVANDILEDCKMKSAKLYVFPSRNLLFLGLATNDLVVTKGDKTFRWTKFHVANVIYVQEGNKSVPYIIDPLLFDGPVRQETWEHLFRKSDSRASTRFTSSATYRWSYAYDDEQKPDRPQHKAQALKDMEDYRRETHALNRNRSGN